MTKPLVGVCAPSEPVHVTVANDYFVPFVVISIAFVAILARYIVDTRPR